MVRRRLFTGAVVFALEGCLRHAARPVPVACPPERLRESAPARAGNAQIHVDGPPPTPLFQGRYTVVVDDRILAIVRTDADTVALLKAWKSVDMITVKSIEILRGSAAAARYPKAVGDVIRFTRCY